MHHWTEVGKTLLKLYLTVISKYSKQEQTSTKNLFLVCSYRTFRGLEHLKITVTVECDMYFLQHYLLETLARYKTTLLQLFYKRAKLLQNYGEGIEMEWKWNRTGIDLK